MKQKKRPHGDKPVKPNTVKDIVSILYLERTDIWQKEHGLHLWGMNYLNASTYNSVHILAVANGSVNHTNFHLLPSAAV